MNTARAAAIVLGREVRAEMRTRELLQTTIVFAVIVVVLFNFAFEPSVGEARRFGPGLIWIALFFSASKKLSFAVIQRTTSAPRSRAISSSRPISAVPAPVPRAFAAVNRSSR